MKSCVSVLGIAAICLHLGVAPAVAEMNNDEKAAAAIATVCMVMPIGNTVRPAVMSKAIPPARTSGRTASRIAAKAPI